MSLAKASKVRSAWYKKLQALQDKEGGGKSDFYEAQGVWDSVRSRFPEGSINGELAGRVLRGLQEEGSIEVRTEKDVVGVRFTAQGREKLVAERTATRTRWLAYFGAVTGGLSLVKSIIDIAV